VCGKISFKKPVREFSKTTNNKIGKKTLENARTVKVDDLPTLQIIRATLPVLEHVRALF
jgi:hypothetical protein